MGECVESAASSMKQQTEDILAATKVVCMCECMCAVKPHCVRTRVRICLQIVSDHYHCLHQIRRLGRAKCWAKHFPYLALL